MVDDTSVGGDDRDDNHMRYSLSTLYEAEDTKTYLIREHDGYGEFPNIFVKVYINSRTSRPTRS